MRSYRRRRFARRTTRRIGRRNRKAMRRMMLRRRIKKFVNKMGYPSYVKMIGMTESKRLLLRKTLTLDAQYSTEGSQDAGQANTNVFQIVLNPLECPNVNKVFSTVTIKALGSASATEESDQPYPRYFRYDYMRIRNIFISIKPAQTVSTTNTGLYNDDPDKSGISNVYAYFTYRYPMLGMYDKAETIKKMYGTNPNPDRIVQEGRLKNTYSWPSNKAMTISLNTLKYRVINQPFKICQNSPLDIQYLSTLSPTENNSNTIYDPFKFSTMSSFIMQRQGMDEFEESDDGQDLAEFGITQDGASIPDLATNNYNLFFGRLVIVSPKKVKFTTEICYDCVLYR